MQQKKRTYQCGICGVFYELKEKPERCYICDNPFLEEIVENEKENIQEEEMGC
jgi:hypothetical protein